MMRSAITEVFIFSSDTKATPMRGVFEVDSSIKIAASDIPFISHISASK